MKALLTALQSPAGWAGALLMALVIAIGTTLDGPEDHQGDWAMSQELQDLQATEAGTDRQQAAAQALCHAERGPNSEARFTPEGHLVCTTRRGLRHAQAQL